METIGERIKIVRGGESRDSLASKIGFSRNTIVNYETGKSDPVTSFLAKILVERPNINPTWLLTGEGSKERDEELLYNGASPTPVDHSLLEAIIAAVEGHLTAIKGALPPEKKATLIITLYDLFSDKEERKIDKSVVVSLIKLAA